MDQPAEITQQQKKHIDSCLLCISVCMLYRCHQEMSAFGFESYVNIHCFMPTGVGGMCGIH